MCSDMCFGLSTVTMWMKLLDVVANEREETDAGCIFLTESMRRYCLPVSIELLSGSDGDATRTKSSVKFNPF